MKNYFIVALFLIPSFLFSQFTVVSTQPQNNATNIPLTATISVTFSEALDTNAIYQNADETWFSNVDSMVSYGYSSDLKTTFGTYVLKPNKTYFVAFTFVKAKSGAVITKPFVYYFTTGPSFPIHSVNGTVLSGTTGATPEDAIVTLMSTSIDQSKDGPPPFVSWAIVNNNGTFSIPYVANGTYWPLAFKDVNHDGRIRPDDGTDVIAIGDSIVVNNSSVSNVTLTFIRFNPVTYHEAVTIADSLAKNLPLDRVLRNVRGSQVDSIGRSSSWEFSYTGNGNTKGFQIRTDVFSSRIDTIYDQWQFDWLLSLKPLTNYFNAASSTTVMTNVENAGGRAYRQSSHPDSLYLKIEMSLGDLAKQNFSDMVSDTNQLYWGVMYILEINREPWWIDGKKYLCNFSTGTVIGSRTLSVQDKRISPLEFSLHQNYPNPFNPSTNISFTVPVTGQAVLRVYNMLGQEVAILFNGEAVAGTNLIVVFNASGLASGLYFSKLEFNGKSQIKKMMLIR